MFTASSKPYVEKILSILDPKREFFSHILDVENCLKIKNANFFIKDLRIFEDRDPRNMIIVDNNISSFAFQLENGVPILPFYGGENNHDRELKELSKFIDQIFEIKDGDKRGEFLKDYFMYDLFHQDKTIDFRQLYDVMGERLRRFDCFQRDIDF